VGRKGGVGWFVLVGLGCELLFWGGVGGGEVLGEGGRVVGVG